LVKQIHSLSLAECMRLEKSENQKISKQVVSKNKSVWKKKLEPVLIIHMRIREVTYE
jgi:hypothetical protein